jgi:ABC-2 type transport system permease protein
MRTIRRDKLARVFRRELWTTITRPGFILSTLALPILPLFLIAIGGLMQPERILAGERPARVAIVDESGELDLSVLERDPSLIEGDDRYLPYPDRETARQALLAREITGVVVIPEDFLETGVIDSFRLRESATDGFVRPFGGRLHVALRLALLHQRIPEPVFERIAAGMERGERVFDPDGVEVPEEIVAEDIRRFLVPVVAAFFLAVAIFAGAGYLLLGLSDEKENRVMELLLATLTPDELLAGKLLGIGLAGLLQFAVWVLVIAVPAIALLPGLGIRAEQILWATAFFLGGYLLFGALMLGVGAITDTARHAQQLSGIFTMAAMAPFLFNFLILQDPGGAVSRLLTFIPLTSPITAMLRMAVEPPPFWELALALAILYASAFFALKGASRLFRAAGLLYGKRPTPTEVWRWLVRAQ